MSGLRVSTAAPHFGFIPTEAIVVKAIDGLTPQMVLQGMTGDQYVPYPTAPTIKYKYSQIPPSKARYLMGEPFVWVGQKGYYKSHAHDGEPYTEVGDLAWLDVEKDVESGADSTSSRVECSPPLLKSLRKLAAYKIKKTPSSPNHYQQEVDEYIEALGQYHQRHGQTPLSAVQIVNLKKLCNQHNFGKQQLAKIFKASNLPPCSMDTLMGYVKTKMEGRVLMDQVFPEKTPEAALLRKSRVYPFEQVYADFVFGPKTLGQKLTLGAQEILWTAAKPIVEVMEHWKSPIAN